MGVSEIRGQIIIGKLGNDPLYLKKVKLGSQVQVKTDDVTDWLFLKGDDVQGGFQVKVLQKRQTKQDR